MRLDKRQCALYLLDERARALPLLDLAADLALLQPGRRLVVRVESGLLPVDGLGAVVWPTRKGTAIIIDPSQCEELGSTVANAFAHELAHLLEPERWPEPTRERFANALGPTLLADEPASCAAAAPLVAAVMAGR